MTFKRTEFSSLTLVGLLIAAFCLSGCETVTYPASQSQPIPDIGELTGGYHPDYGTSLRLTLPDLEVDVMALNLVPASWPRPKTGDNLLVLLALSPKTDGVRFDPSHMRYQPDGEQPDHPSLVQGPARKHILVGWGRFKTCIRSSKYPDTYVPVTGSVPVTERACFRIFFDDARSEKRKFTLFIEGISKSGKPLEVPPVDFKHKIWTQDQLFEM